MLNLQFIGLNLSFAANLFAALVCFGVFWLIFDAWTVRHKRVELIKWAGFLLLSVGFLINAATSQAIAEGLAGFVDVLADVLRGMGYIAIIAGQLLDPLQPKPVYDDKPADGEPPKIDPATVHVPKTTPGSRPQTVVIKPTVQRSHSFMLIGGFIALVLPVLAGLISFLYLRRATTGLERHLKPVAIAFGALTLFEALSAAAFLRDTANPTLYQLVAIFGPVWWTTVAALIIGTVVLGMWVWQYLTKRLQSQLFMILVAQTISLFLISTIGFTFMLFQNIRTQSLADLTTASRVLDYAVASRQAETTAQAEAAASNAGVVAAVAARNHNALVTALKGYLSDHNLTSLVVTDGNGQVLLRGEDPTRWGDSRSSDALVRRALVGQASSSVIVADGVTSPTVTLVAAYPVRDTAGLIIGTVTAGRAITGAFVDGIRASTGLESAVYGGNVRAATTLLAANQTDRAVGIKETSTAVTNQVLKQGKTYSGSVSLQNRPYLASFAPLRDGNKVTVGMLLVARPEDTLFTSANQSIQLTFMFVIGLVLLAIYPIFLVARYLSNQLK
jgi:hypothetical protein